MCVVRFTWHILEFYTHEISLEQLKLRFQTGVWLCEILALWCLTIPHVGMVIVTWHHFYSLGPRLYLWSKFGMQLERKEYYNYMCSMGMKLESRDLLEFWEISADISKKDRVFSGRLIGNYVSYWMAQISMTLSHLECHFGCFKPF